MANRYLHSLMGENERILLIAHQHWFILVNSILAEIIFILVLISAAVAGSIFFPLFSWLIIGIAALLMLIPIITLTRDVLVWQNREYIITNLRVMQVAGVFNKSITDSSLEKVNDIKMDQSAVGRMFNFGDVEILTASELGANLFRRIEDPVRFKTTMLNAKERLEHPSAPPASRAASSGGVYSSADIPTLIAQLDDLRQKGILSEEEFQAKKARLLEKL